MLNIHHINLQPRTGGGEVYTRFFTRALAGAGAHVMLYAHPANRTWDGLAGERIEIVPVRDEAELAARLPRTRSLLLTQSPLSEACVERLAATHFVAGFAHMPMFGRSAAEFKRFHLVLTVSQYCIDLLRKAGIEHVHAEPMYGIADLERGDPKAPIVACSPYVWDRRKFRDVLLGALEPVLSGSEKTKSFEKRQGLTFGIVSLISPIKQFPLLFSHLAPALARHGVNLEIFGAGGYAQVRDLRRSLEPLDTRARFWGHQDNVGAIYPRLDYLLTGLPDKEALGLNVLEALACGTPVLAPRGGPFPETVLHARTGLLYRDPREDQGADFERTLDGILKKEIVLDPRGAKEHLARFSYAALLERAARLLEDLARKSS